MSITDSLGSLTRMARISLGPPRLRPRQVLVTIAVIALGTLLLWLGLAGGHP